jgi:hypothetical protein
MIRLLTIIGARPQEIREYVMSASAQSKGRVLGDTSRSKKVLAEVLRIFDEILDECK